MDKRAPAALVATRNPGSDSGLTPEPEGSSLWEAVLQDPQQFVATIFEQAGEGIGICDAEGRFVFVNSVGRAIAEVEAVGTDLHSGRAVWGDWYDREDRLLPVERWPVTRALKGEAVVSDELYKRLPDGTRYCIVFASAPIRCKKGRIVGAIVTTSDITDRRRSEEQLQAVNSALEQRLRTRTAALEAAQEALQREAWERRRTVESLGRSRRMLQDILNRSTAVIYVKDTDGRYLLINSHFERLFNVSNDAIGGKTDYAVFPAEVAAQLRVNDERVIATGESLHFEEVVPQDGGNHTYISVKFPLRDDDGDIYALCGISTDITERQEIEAELRRSQAALSAVSESSTEAIFSIDRSYRLIACNTALVDLFYSLFGAPPRFGENLSGEMPAELADHWIALLDRALRGERFTVEEDVSIGGEVRHALVSLNPMLMDGRVTGVAVFAKDVTELRRAQDQATQHQAELAHVLRLQTIGEMAASLAHEINQPLGAIANYAQGCKLRLEAGTASPADLLPALEEIAREALRAGEITRRVRELLRKDGPRRDPADLNEIVSTVLEILGPTARQRGVALRFRPGELLPSLEVDRIQIEQVVVNLLLNALDAAESAKTREVELRTAATQDAVELEVRDYGTGLDPALIEKIFEPFFTTKRSGLGMGLAISRSIIEAHDGRLWATPHPAGGTIFRFTLPIDPDGQGGN